MDLLIPMDSSTRRWVGPADPMGHSVPALLAQFLYEAEPTDPSAVFFWVGPETRWVDPAHSHPDPSWVEPSVDSRNHYPSWVEVSINVDVG